VDAAFYWWFISELAEQPYNRSLLLPSLGLITCSIACLAGLVMVIVGREQHYTVREVDPNPTKAMENLGFTRQ
jgi:hypothetical protein